MAVDAKDQVTHGHIRRVQEHSVDLARHMGVDDDNLIKAIEAASLLHDMGKLAIPEHILNKPGKLTAAEFEVMKTHASLWADILAAIDFPYLVVSIVRHHHENWDGSGYPDELSGIETPIGVRILAVVIASTPSNRIDVRTERGLVLTKLSRYLVNVAGRFTTSLVVDVFVQLQSKWSRADTGDLIALESSPLSTTLAAPS